MVCMYKVDKYKHKTTVLGFIHDPTQQVLKCSQDNWMAYTNINQTQTWRLSSNVSLCLNTTNSF